MKRLIPVLLAVLFSACSAEAVQTPDADVPTPSPAVVTTETQIAGNRATEAASPTPAPTPTKAVYGAWWTADRAELENTLPPPGDDRAVLGAYYAPSKAISYGYLTRYLEHDRALDVAVWQVHHFQEQVDHMNPLLGGGYSADSPEYWGDDATRLEYNPVDDHLQIAPQSIIELTPAQVRLYHLIEHRRTLVLAGYTEDKADNAIRDLIDGGYDAIVAMKSPNDIGRVFCVYRVDLWPQTLAARVIVMDTSARNDYTGIGGTDGVPLGYRVATNILGQDVHWLADVEPDLFDALDDPQRGLGGDNSWALFVEDAYDRGCPPTSETLP